MPKSKVFKIARGEQTLWDGAGLVSKECFCGFGYTKFNKITGVALEPGQVKSFMLVEVK